MSHLKITIILMICFSLDSVYPLQLTKYSMIQKDELNFVSLYFEIICRWGEGPVPVVDSMVRTVNGASTHARQLVAVFQVLCSLYLRGLRSKLS